jgi:hypothetical protein
MHVFNIPLKLDRDFLAHGVKRPHGRRPTAPVESIIAHAFRVALEEPLFAAEDRIKRRTDATGFTNCVRCRRRMSENMRALCGHCRRDERG